MKHGDATMVVEHRRAIAARTRFLCHIISWFGTNVSWWSSPCVIREQGSFLGEVGQRRLTLTTASGYGTLRAGGGRRAEGKGEVAAMDLYPGVRESQPRLGLVGQHPGPSQQTTRDSRRLLHWLGNPVDTDWARICCWPGDPTSQPVRLWAQGSGRGGGGPSGGPSKREGENGMDQER
jgi:hypothetical protein